MRTLDPEIPLQKELARQIYQAMQGDVIDSIRRSYVGDSDVCLHSDMRGHSLPVKSNILPDLYQLCENVKQTLGFDEPIDFYITGTSEVNACAICSDIPGQPHIIDINSALFNLMSEDELKYIIGHEIGHLINRDRDTMNLFRYVYPSPDDRDNAPSFLTARYDLWGRIAELSADRYGYIACENLDACVTAIFKLASGLHLDKMNIQIDDLMALNSQNLDFFLEQNMNFGGSHPVNPIRIQALHLFAKAKTQKALNEGMDMLIGMLNAFFYTNFDDACACFNAAAGLYICGTDGRLDKREEEMILNYVAGFSLFPSKLLKQIAKADYMTVMKQSMNAILDIMPGHRTQILIYLIDLAFIDGIIEDEEVKRINVLGEALGFSAAEITDALTSKIRAHFKPMASLMK